MLPEPTGHIGLGELIESTTLNRAGDSQYSAPGLPLFVILQAPLMSSLVALGLPVRTQSDIAAAVSPLSLPFSYPPSITFLILPRDWITFASARGEQPVRGKAQGHPSSKTKFYHTFFLPDDADTRRLTERG